MAGDKISNNEMEKISVIIVTWNAQAFIAECLESVLAQQDINDLEIFVIDNGSTDQTVEIVNQFKSHVRLIENIENKGFCYANNQGFKKAAGDYIFVLNSDIVLENNYLKKLLYYLKKNPKAGMVQGKFLRMDKITIDSLGLKLSFMFRFFNIAEGKTNSEQFKSPFKIFGPCAAAALYTGKLIDDIARDGEVFDEKFFFLAEDFDAAWRARNRGWEAMCVPEAVCYHYRDSSIHKSSFRQYLSLRNRYYLIIKNLNFDLVSLLRCLLAFCLYDFPRFVWIVLFNRRALRFLTDIRENYSDLTAKRLN